MARAGDPAAGRLGSGRGLTPSRGSLNLARRMFRVVRYTVCRYTATPPPLSIHSHAHACMYRHRSATLYPLAFSPQQASSTTFTCRTGRTCARSSSTSAHVHVQEASPTVSPDSASMHAGEGCGGGGWCHVPVLPALHAHTGPPGSISLTGDWACRSPDCSWLRIFASPKPRLMKCSADSP